MISLWRHYVGHDTI